MSIERLLSTPCTIYRRASTGLTAHGEATYSETSTTTRCHLNQRDATEDAAPDEIAGSRATVYLLPSEEITKRDRVTIDGRSWEVDGIPIVRRNAHTGVAHHLEVPVRATS